MPLPLFSSAGSVVDCQKSSESGRRLHRVRWRLKEVLSLDILDDELDGAEVYAESVDVPEEHALQFDSTFTPEARTPPQTV